MIRVTTLRGKDKIPDYVFAHPSPGELCLS
uniref:Uncharacterized protein n=1 Tax=Arundo donax TaxID=35708 RepID=A0A0A9FXM2_ARUDO